MSFRQKLQQNLEILKNQISPELADMIAEPPPQVVFNTSEQRARELSRRYGDVLKEMMEESERRGIELGAMLCTEGEVTGTEFAQGSGSIRIGCRVVGGPTFVRIKDCRDGIHSIGSLHTHREGFLNDMFSVNDITNGIGVEEALACLLFRENGAIHLSCISPRVYNSFSVRSKLWIWRQLEKAHEAEEKARTIATLKNPQGLQHEWQKQVFALTQQLTTVQMYLGKYELTLGV